MEIVYTNAKNNDFITLCKLLDNNLDEIAGGAEKRSIYKQHNLLDEIENVVVIYLNEIPVASGGFKKYSEDVAELKRIFVHKDFRGKGISKILIKELELMALKNGYRKLILETGELLVESLNLYKTVGFKIIKNYYPYEEITKSICMEKILIN